MKDFITLLLLLVAGTSSFCQGYFNKWYFGNHGGLDFNTSPPTVISGNMNTLEGTASISDIYGNLLFYTDGVTVWNSKNAVMPNGTGILGNATSTQSALIVPKPGNVNQYYLFSTTWNGGAYTYSIVDMSLNGGLGDVSSTKNIILHPNSCEASTAIRLPNGEDFWIIGHESNSNQFFAYKLTSTGLDTTPVFSHWGSVPTSTYIGYLKPSHKGNKLAEAFHELKLVQVYDFDNTTGMVTNGISIPCSTFLSYGVEFSLDDSRLYYSGYYTGNKGFIYQVNFNAGNDSAIINSTKLIASINSDIGALQLAPDSNIYVAQRGFFLGVINEPDSLGALCNYVYNQINFTPGCSYGLPNFFEMNYCNTPYVNLGEDTILCLGDSLILNATTSKSTYLWQDSSTNPTFTVTQSGTYWVQVSINNCKTIDTINVSNDSYPTIDLGIDTMLCQGDTLKLNASTPNAIYKWQDNSMLPTFYVTSQGTYWVEVKNNCGITSDTINIEIEDCACHIFIPDVFSPNADSLNDRFSPVSSCYYLEYNFLIFDRWGKKIFETKNPYNFWDGTYKGEKLPTGVYIYLVKCKFENNVSEKKYGSITLIR